MTKVFGSAIEGGVMIESIKMRSFEKMGSWRRMTNNAIQLMTIEHFME